MGVGRRGFELGSASVFPAVRVEIDLEEWHTTLSLSHSELYTLFFFWGGGSFLNVLLAFNLIFSES